MKDRDRVDKGLFRVAKFSRRQFLKRAGVAATGAALASISLAASCKSTDSTPDTTVADTNPTTGSSPVVTTISTTAAKTTIQPTTSSSTSSPPTTGATPSTTPTASLITTSSPTGNIYVPPIVLPQMIAVPGTSCSVATDRNYSKEHMWVKTLTDKTVVVGITATMVEILGEPYNISLLPSGTEIYSNGAFGSMEGYKMNADLITPVSGKIIQTNSSVTARVTEDPYNGGWIIVVQLSKPEELKSLLTPQKYRDLVAG